MSVIHFGGGCGNEILKPITPEKLADGTPACGFDQYDQLWVRINHKDDPTSWTGHIVADPRAKVCPVCQKGWANTVESIADQEYIHSMERLAHRTCMNGYGHLSNFFFWHGVVCNVERDKEKPALKIEETKNLYGSGWTGPWYQIKYDCLPNHVFTVGMRKRVYQITISNVPKEFADLLEFAFKAEEQVTRGYDSDGWYTHAWGREKAEKYFNTIYNLANNWQTELAKKAEPTQP